MRGTESFWVKPSAKALYSSLSMTLAFMGHTEMQRKQARHLALSIVRQSSEIAPVGHSLTHLLHFTQASVVEGRKIPPLPPSL